MHQSIGDADTLIVHCALKLATQGTEVMVLADDTDVLILLIYQWYYSMLGIQLNGKCLLSARMKQNTEVLED